MSTSRAMWDRRLWGVLLTSGSDTPLLLGDAWHPDFRSFCHYRGEPLRVLSFVTKKHAQDFCRVLRERYKARGKDDPCSRWRFRPARIREHITTQATVPHSGT